MASSLSPSTTSPGTGEAEMMPDGQSTAFTTHPKEQSCSEQASSPGNCADDQPSLPHIADKVPLQVWIIILISTLERFAFFGLREPFQNYLQNPIDDPLRPGALGLGQSTATNLSYLFSFLLYTMPLLASVVIDGYLGRYRGLVLALSIYLAGVSTLLITSIPVCLRAGAGLPGFLIGIVLMSLGIGGVKASMSPLMADQYTKLEDRVIEKSNGKRFLITRELSISKIYSIYYWGINMGALAALATTYLEKDVGFWAAYLLPFCALCCSAITLVVCRNKIAERPPDKNILPKAFKVLLCAAKSGFSMEAARPQNRAENVDWSDSFVTDLQRGILACRIFAMYPFIWICHLQINNNLISQAAQMETNSLPNDIFPTLNPIAVLVLLPLVQYFLYPALRKLGLSFPPINRMTAGFVIQAAAIAFCTGVQHLIYSRGPCYEHALECDASDGGRIPNRINGWVQAPVYILDGLAEIFFDIPSQEYAYNKAPDNMKSIVQAVLSAMAGVGAAVGFALHPVSHNPHLVYMYASLAAATFIVAIIFWLAFHKYNKVDKQLNQRDTTTAAALPRADRQVKE